MRILLSRYCGSTRVGGNYKKPNKSRNEKELFKILIKSRKIKKINQENLKNRLNI